ncbi:hypothetical protein CLCAR_0398 [Clostridium carboxidivorans P7]|nr:hypothetical protein CLCAR_0398 [Clostridium carboxidivorans P7]
MHKCCDEAANNDHVDGRICSLYAEAYVNLLNYEKALD